VRKSSPKSEKTQCIRYAKRLLPGMALKNDADVNRCATEDKQVKTIRCNWKRHKRRPHSLVFPSHHPKHHLSSSTFDIIMRTSLISIITFFASAGLIKAAPTYLGLADDFDPGSPPTHNSGADDLHGHPKVVAIATRFNAGTKEVLLTRAQGSKKGLELIRGKMKAGETSYEGANREAYEESKYLSFFLL
jgi:hypothetical protein